MTDTETDTDTDVTELAKRVIDELDPGQTIGDKIVLSRRQLLAIAGGGLSVGALGTLGVSDAQAQSAVGTIGTASSPVDVEAASINNSGTVTTQDLVVNGTATGPFGGGIVLEAGDSITVKTIRGETTDVSFVNLYNSTAKDVLGGTVFGGDRIDFLYTFSSGATLHKNGTGTTYTSANQSVARDQNGDLFEVGFLPPAKDVTKIEVGSNQFNSTTLGAEVILKD